MAFSSNSMQKSLLQGHSIIKQILNMYLLTLQKHVSKSVANSEYCNDASYEQMISI